MKYIEGLAETLMIPAWLLGELIEDHLTRRRNPCYSKSPLEQGQGSITPERGVMGVSRPHIEAPIAIGGKPMSGGPEPFAL